MASPSLAIPNEMFTPTEQVLWSARLGVLLSIYRIAQALRAFPPNPDPLANMRWSHGIGRELVRYLYYYSRPHI